MPGILDWLGSFGQTPMGGNGILQGATPNGQTLDATQPGILQNITGGLQDHQNALLGLSAGLLSPQGLRGAMGQGFQNFAVGQQVDQRLMKAKRAEAAAKLFAQAQGGDQTDPKVKAAWALLGSDPETAGQAALLKIKDPPSTNDITEFKYARDNGFTGSFQDWMEQKPGGAGSMGLVPTGYMGADNKFHYGQISKHGGAQDLPAPNGGTWLPPVTYENTGTGLVPVTKYGTAPEAGNAPTGAGPGGVIPVDNAGKAAQTDLGQGLAANKLQYNQAIVKMDAMDAAVEGLAKDPRLDKSIGGMGQFDVMHPIDSINRAGNFSGTDTYDYRAKVKETVSQEFGAALPAMRGLGSLSDAEGKKVEAAMGNLDPNQSPAEFKASLARLQARLKDMRAAMEKDVQGKVGPQAPAVPGGAPPAPGGTPDLIYVPGKGLVPAGGQ